VKSFLDFWLELSWFANLLTIVLGAYSLYKVVMISLKFVSNKFSKEYVYSDVSSYLEAKKYSSYNKLSKSVVIVDDNPENYPVDYLRDFGFTVKVIESISLSDISQLYNYDLIILDITGIVLEDPVRGGLELLKRIKEVDPTKLIISASSKRFDPTLTDFFKLSDSQIKTPISETNLENKINEMFKKKFCPQTTASKLDEYILGKNISPSDKSKLMTITLKYIEGVFSGPDFLKKCSWISSELNIHKYKELTDNLKGLM
jgi:CheY-like chemotaxis protein